MNEVATSARALCASAQLKAGTQALHHQLDHQCAMQRLVARDLTLAEYADLLERMGRCYRAIETVLDAFVLAHPQAAHWADPAVYRRTQDIEKDLQALQRQAHLQIPPPRAAPQALGKDAWMLASAGGGAPALCVSSAAQAAGCMYVLGGARMGARVIVQALHSHLGEAVMGAVHFFGASQPADAPDFSTLRAKLDAALRTPAAAQEALVTAQQVFGIFIHEFSQPGTDRS